MISGIKLDFDIIWDPHFSLMHSLDNFSPNSIGIIEAREELSLLNLITSSFVYLCCEIEILPSCVVALLLLSGVIFLCIPLSYNRNIYNRPIAIYGYYLNNKCIAYLLYNNAYLL